MSTISYIRKENISSIVLRFKIKSDLKLYPARPERKNFWGKVIGEAIPESYRKYEDGPSYWVKEELDKYNMLLEDEVVYHKAHVTVYIIGECSQIKYFKTDDEALIYANATAKASGIDFIAI